MQTKQLHNIRHATMHLLCRLQLAVLMVINITDEKYYKDIGGRDRLLHLSINKKRSHHH